MASPSVHSTRSLVNKYELTLLETNHLGKKPSNDQLQKCFQTLDEIIPVLGQYQRVMKLIRDDVYEAVFSREYTVAIERDLSGKESGSGRTSASVERVPHFVILNKIMDERNKRADDAEEETKRLKVVIEELNEKISILCENVDGLEDVIRAQKKEILDLKADVATKVQENIRLTKELEAQHEDMTRELKTLESSVQDLNAKLTQESTRVIELTRFKKCHDNVQNDFRDPSAFSPSPLKALFSAKEQKLRKDITEGQKLENQLLMLRNTCINEFDKYLEREVSEERAVNVDAVKGLDKHNDQSFETLRGEERQKREIAFVNMIANIEKELDQNELHLSVLKADLDKLNETKRQSHSKAKVLQKLENGPGRNSSEENESKLLEMIKDSSINYQFLPQEPILNKYAITAFYSCNQGKTFLELQNVRHCRSCGQKTLVCPHKVSTGEKVFHLPLQCTHIKFTRPGLHVSDTIKQDTPDDESLITAVPSHQQHSKSSYSRLWNDLTVRQHFTRQIPRVIEEDYLVSLIKQFFDSTILDDSSDDEDVLVPLLESWYTFLNDRYQVPSVALSVARDVLEAVARTVHSNRHVQLFADCMCGILDPAAFRYYLVFCRLVQTIKWTSMEDFSLFAKIVYRFMNVDDLEQFTMSYTSFSENKISGKLICNFLLYIILKQREPSFHEMEKKLLNYSDPSTGYITDVVFFEAMAEISPLLSERLCHHLFAQSKADTQDNHVSISRLSQIACFLDLQQRTAVMEMEIKEKLQVTEDWLVEMPYWDP